MTTLRRIDDEVTLERNIMDDTIEVRYQGQCVPMFMADFVNLKTKQQAAAKIKSVADMLKHMVQRDWQLTPERYRDGYQG